MSKQTVSRYLEHFKTTITLDLKPLEGDTVEILRYHRKRDDSPRGQICKEYHGQKTTYKLLGIKRPEVKA